MWWNKELFELKQSTRSAGGYSIQQCEVEIVLDKDSIPADSLVTLSVGARVYDNNDARTFKTTPTGTFDWFRQQMTYTPELEIPATYDEGTEVAVEGEVKEAVVDLSSALQTRIAAAGITADTTVAAPSSNLEMLPGVRMEAPTMRATISATQTIKNGYKLYEKITESDWWWWYVALDIPDALLSNGETLYQFVTMTDPTSTASYTVGCSITIGTADTYAIQYFKHVKG